MPTSPSTTTGADAVETKHVRLQSRYLGNYDIADKIRELVLKGAAVAKRVGSSWASRCRVTT
jgi:methionine synthase I (cobalamin-dependent)